LFVSLSRASHSYRIGQDPALRAKSDVDKSATAGRRRRRSAEW
jgi:hypothetical protein